MCSFCCSYRGDETSTPELASGPQATCLFIHWYLFTQLHDRRSSDLLKLISPELALPLDWVSLDTDGRSHAGFQTSNSILHADSPSSPLPCVTASTAWLMSVMKDARVRVRASGPFPKGLLSGFLHGVQQEARLWGQTLSSKGSSAGLCRRSPPSAAGLQVTREHGVQSVFPARMHGVQWFSISSPGQSLPPLRSLLLGAWPAKHVLPESSDLPPTVVLYSRPSLVRAGAASACVAVVSSLPGAENAFQQTWNEWALSSFICRITALMLGTESSCSQGLAQYLALFLVLSSLMTE